MAAANAPDAPTVLKVPAIATAHTAARTNLRRIKVTDDFLLFDKILTGIPRPCKQTGLSERALTVYACHLCRHSETARWASTGHPYGVSSLTALSRKRYAHAA